MHHLGTKTITTQRLILRRFKASDSEFMFKNWATDTKTTKYLTWKPHTNISETKEIISNWIQNYKQDNFYHWAIVLKEIDEPIGSILVGRPIDNNIKSAIMGYCIGSQWWHQGIMSEALTTIIKFLFDEVGVNRIEARHDTLNPNSGKVMLKCGMKYEGTLRQSGWNNQGICDVSYYGLLKSEWDSMQK